MSRLPRAVVFDCDGTLADTEPISDRAWADVLAEHGYEPTAQDALATVGRPYPATFAHYASRVDLGDATSFRRELRARFLARFETELALFEDAVTLARQLDEAGVAIGVASSSSHAHVDRVLERAGLEARVGAVVGSDDVTRHKPHPEPYLRALATLGVGAAGAAAIEDTAVGVASARGAGLYTIAVVRGHVPVHLLDEADLRVATVALSDLEDGPWTS